MSLLHSLLISMSLNWAMFLPAYFLRTDKLTDLSYAISFVALTSFSLLNGEITTPKLILFGMILLWGLRIGTYLFIRIKKINKDDRFDDMRGHFFRFLGFWTLQGLTVWLVLLPSLMTLSKDKLSWEPLSWIGGIIWAAGLLIEGIADQQKFNFKKDPSNKEKWIETGLWKYSRHPNYFGEIISWVGIYLYVLPYLVGGEKILGLIGPSYIAFLIIFVSGIPLLEQKAEERWGESEQYKRYKNRTSLLIPLPKKQ